MPTNDLPQQEHSLPAATDGGGRVEIPIKVRIVGTPSGADLDRLTESVARAVAKQLRAARPAGLLFAAALSDVAEANVGAPPMPKKTVPQSIRTPRESDRPDTPGQSAGLGALGRVRHQAAKAATADEMSAAQADRNEIVAAAAAVLDARSAGIAEFVDSIAHQLKAITATADGEPLPAHLSVGMARILQRMVDKARQRQTEKPDFRIIQLTGKNGGHPSGGRLLDIDRYNGFRIDFQHGGEAVRAVTQFYADMLDVPLFGPPASGVTPVPVGTRFSLGLTRNPRMARTGANLDAADKRKRKYYDTSAPGHPILLPQFRYRDFFFPRETPQPHETKPPTMPGGGTIEGAISALAPQAKTIFERLQAGDTGGLLKSLFPDGVDHLHVQIEK
ncbi:hypothetical protein [Nocardia sp. NPDC049149]|uniref:hypothetical protein n=1 Tax=Nocardia sp. NPDC049149 TaxID=3364315 RepID=UPI00371BBAB0